MTVSMRRLNADGIARFAEFLRAAKAAGDQSPPHSLLDDPATSESVVPNATVPRDGPTTKRAVAELLAAALAPLRGPDLQKDRGLWAWLALRWFDSVCPVVNGKREVMDESHYIPQDDFRRRYRHFVRTPYQFLLWAPDHNRLWLDQPVSSHGDLMEQTASRLFLLRVSAIRSAMDRLYFDVNKGKMKTGALSERNPGNIRKRLPVRIRQLRRTYDVNSLTSDGLIHLLGSEFEGWLKK